MTHAVHPGRTEAFHLTESVQWWADDAECTLVVSRPGLDADLWSRYGRGAVASYQRFGVEAAIDVDVLRTGEDTAMFFVAVDEDGTMLGGVRAKGPLNSPEDSHAIAEWDGQVSQPAVRKMIADRLPYGVLEMKSAWVIDDPNRRGVSDAIARSGFHMMALLDAQFCMATSAAYVLNRWRSSGGVIAPIPATPYPDERYQTKLMWWDRRNFARHAQPPQTARIYAETQAITEKFGSGRVHNGRASARRSEA